MSERDSRLRRVLRAISVDVGLLRRRREYRLLVAGQVRTDDEGYVITEGRSTRTGLPGVFTAGDLVDHTYRQAVTAWRYVWSTRSPAAKTPGTPVRVERPSVMT